MSSRTTRLFLSLSIFFMISCGYEETTETKPRSPSMESEINAQLEEISPPDSQSFSATGPSCRGSQSLAAGYGYTFRNFETFASNHSNVSVPHALYIYKSSGSSWKSIFSKSITVSPNSSTALQHIVTLEQGSTYFMSAYIWDPCANKNKGAWLNFSKQYTAR